MTESTVLQPLQEISQHEADELMLSVPGVALNIQDHFQHILKKEVTLDAEPYATIPTGTPLFGEEKNGFIVFQFGEYKRQIPKRYFLMFDRLGQEIITLLEPLEYITLRGGLVELVNQADGEARSITPQAKVYVDGAWTGEYQNLSPDHSETCIVFSEFQEYTVNERTNLYERFTLRFRVIVWFNEAKIDYDGYAGEKISKDLTTKIRRLSLYKKPQINFESMTADPARIWSAYSFKPDDALFMAPYRTFAITFALRAFEMIKCEDTTTINMVC